MLFRSRSLAVINQRFHTPHRAIISGGVVGVATIYLVSWLSGDKQGDVMFNIAVISVLGMMAMYSVSIAALFKLRKSRPDMVRPFKVPFYPIVPAFSLIGTTFAFACMAWYYTSLVIVFAALSLIGFVIFRVAAAK